MFVSLASGALYIMRLALFGADTIVLFIIPWGRCERGPSIYLTQTLKLTMPIISVPLFLSLLMVKTKSLEGSAVGRNLHLSLDVSALLVLRCPKSG